jgi:hypothetical protein
MRKLENDNSETALRGRTTERSLPARSGGQAGYRSCGSRARVIRLTVLVRLFAAMLRPLAAHAQNATWLMKPAVAPGGGMVSSKAGGPEEGAQ